MMNAKRTIYLTVTLLVIGMTALGCATGEGPSGGQPVLSTDVPTNVPSPSLPPTIDKPATQAAEETQDALATSDTAATLTAKSITATNAQITQWALNKASTATQEAGFRLTATADVIQQATAQAQVMVDAIQKLFTDGVISSTEGDYYRIDDFDETFAQINYYQWWPTDYSAENFVIAGDFFMSSASQSANWFNSACGVVFNLVDKRNHNIVWVAMDGRAYMQSVHKGNSKLFAILKWGAASKTETQGHFMMVVSEKHVTLYVDDQEVFSVYDGLLTSGLIANTLVSGTNKDYGTRCKMTDVDLWIMK